MNPPKPQHKTARNIVIAILILICIGISYFAYQAFKTRPLGDSNKLQYIGKVDYGCWVCDSMPASDYYYATDMTVDEMIGYFKKATIEESPSLIGDHFYFGLKLANGQSMYTSLYLKKSDVYKQTLFFRPTQKHYFLSVPDFNYEGLKSSL